MTRENHKELTNKPITTFPTFWQNCKSHPWNFTQSSGSYYNSLLVYNICRKQSRFSCVSTIYFFVGALMWITASLDLHVCKELMDLPPFRRPRNTQTIWNIPSRKKNVFEKPQFWKKKMRWRIEFILGKLHEFLNSIIHNLTVFHFIVLFLVWWYQYNSEKINGKKRQFLFCYVCRLWCTLDKKHGLSKIRWGFWCFVPWDFFASCSPVKIVFREFAVVADAALQTRVLG